ATSTPRRRERCRYGWSASRSSQCPCSRPARARPQGAHRQACEAGGETEAIAPPYLPWSCQDQHRRDFNTEPAMRIAALLVVLSIACSPVSARADDVATAQGVIRAQEQAFGHDDAAAAYSYAAPAVKQI